jgi:hypothetical protein
MAARFAREDFRRIVGVAGNNGGDDGGLVAGERGLGGARSQPGAAIDWGFCSACSAPPTLGLDARRRRLRRLRSHRALSPRRPRRPRRDALRSALTSSCIVRFTFFFSVSTLVYDFCIEILEILGFVSEWFRIVIISKIDCCSFQLKCGFRRLCFLFC